MRHRHDTQRRAVRIAMAALTVSGGLALAPFALADEPRTVDAGVPALPGARVVPLGLVLASDQLQATDKARVAIQVSRPSICVLKLSGPGHRRAAPIRGKATRRYATWTWKVPSSVRGGTWQAKVSCRFLTRSLRRATGKTRNVKFAISVAPSLINRGPLAKRTVVRFRNSRTPPTSSAVLQTAGKGSGGYPNVNALCKWTKSPNGKCSNYDWGYLRSNGSWAVNSERGFGYRNCTDFAAWATGVTWSSFGFPAGRGNAIDWKDYAPNAGFQVTGSASVGDIAWWNTGKYGHVAIVTAVHADGSVATADFNGSGMGIYTVRPNTRANAYLHKPNTQPPPPPNPKPQPQPAPQPQPTVQPQPTPNPQPVPPNPGSPTPTPAPPPPPAPVPAPPSTFSAQQGSRGVNTFANPYNASGMGPRIAAGSWVQVSCKLYAPQIASVNPDGYWYRIASAPWNNGYYSPANTFMNGDPWGGPYSRNTDWSIRNC